MINQQRAWVGGRMGGGEKDGGWGVGWWVGRREKMD